MKKKKKHIFSCDEILSRFPLKTAFLLHFQDGLANNLGEKKNKIKREVVEENNFVHNEK